jgi:hypothetical protein
MLGLSPREARRRYDSVIDFAELRDFAELKIKNYSSGMLVRLAFAVMIHVDAEILLVDEVLAVGDAAFQQKCFDEFYRLRDEGRTVILVTHDMGAVERFCDRAILLEQGNLVRDGDPGEVGMQYLQVNFAPRGRAAAGAEEPAAPDEPAQDGEEAAAVEEAEPVDLSRAGDGRAQILAAWFEDADGVATTTLETGRACTFAARVRFVEELEDPLFGVTLENAAHDHVMGATTLWTEPRSGRFTAGEELVFRVRFTNVFEPGRYDATPAIAARGGLAWIDWRKRFCSVVVTGIRTTGAIVQLPFEFVLERADAPATRTEEPVQ